MSNIYTLNVRNNSTQSGSFCIFQEQPDVNMPGLITLAWLAKMSHPTTELEFKWIEDYCFVWSKTTKLEPGSIINTGQHWAANLKTKNKITFDYQDGAYTFEDEKQGDYEGNLYIDQTENVQPETASVGIGMSGEGTFLFASEPNMKIIMSPRSKPIYWLIFGDFAEGEVLDITQVSEQALKLQYDGTETMNVEFTGDNTWKII